MEALLILALDSHITGQEAGLVVRESRLGELLSRDLVDVTHDGRHGPPPPAGALGAYFGKDGVVDVGPTNEIIMEQGYEIDRPSRILVHGFSDDDMIQEIKVGGQTVMVAEGKLLF